MDGEMKKFIKYYKKEFDNNGNLIDTKEVKLSFDNMIKHSNCFDWYYLSNNITEDTCTRDFITTFGEHLKWYNGNFLMYVPDDIILKNMNRIDKGSIFSRRQFSEEFCSKILDDILNTSPKYANDMYFTNLKYMIKYQKNLSNDFLQKYLFTKITTDKVKGIIPDYRVGELMRNLAEYFPLTEEQYLIYIVKTSKYTTKFSRFTALVNADSNYSLDFIKNHRKGLNEKAFLNTDQVKYYLSHNKISENALTVFKQRINWIDLINSHETKAEVLEYMGKHCKKEIFDTIMKHSDKLNNKKNLEIVNRSISEKV